MQKYVKKSTNENLFAIKIKVFFSIHETLKAQTFDGISHHDEVKLNVDDNGKMKNVDFIWNWAK